MALTWTGGTADNAKAPRHYFTVGRDGLAQPWHVGAVWLNPRYGKTSTPKVARQGRA